MCVRYVRHARFKIYNVTPANKEAGQQQNRTQQHAMQSQNIEIPMSAVTSTHTDSTADNKTSRQCERARERECVRALWPLFMVGNIGACAVCVLGIWKSESIAIFFSMTQFELIFLKWASDAHIVCCGLCPDDIWQQANHLRLL